jgi:hypothetical protein
MDLWGPRGLGSQCRLQLLWALCVSFSSLLSWQACSGDAALQLMSGCKSCDIGSGVWAGLGWSSSARVVCEFMVLNDLVEGYWVNGVQLFWGFGV